MHSALNSLNPFFAPATETSGVTPLCGKSYTALAEGEEDFGFTDQKGRKIGYKWTINRVTYTALPAEAQSGYRRAPGSELEVWGTPTRNGAGYGPAFNRTPAKTVEEAEKIVATRIKNSRRDNTKKFSK